MTQIIRIAKQKKSLRFIELLNEDLETLMDSYERIEKTSESETLNGIEITKKDLSDLHDVILKKSFDNGEM